MFGTFGQIIEYFLVAGLRVFFFFFPCVGKCPLLNIWRRCFIKILRRLRNKAPVKN